MENSSNLRYDVLRTRDGNFITINVADLLPVVSPGYWSQPNSPEKYESSRAAVAAWCAANGAYLYVYDEDSFNLYIAAQEATAAGLERIVYENLS